MSTDGMLRYNGATPTQGPLGHRPRELYGPEVKALSTAAVALETNPDAVEVGTHLRTMAKQAFLQSIVEEKLRVAQNAKMQ